MVETIKALTAEIARLKEIISRDSKTSSKPPSLDIIKKSENKKLTQETVADEAKRKPGGQPSHEGKTRKGFGRVDRTLNPASRGMSAVWRHSLYQFSKEP